MVCQSLEWTVLRLVVKVYVVAMLMGFFLVALPLLALRLVHLRPSLLFDFYEGVARLFFR
jgi:hypothetical protein